MKNIENSILINSPDYDSHFMDLIRELERCGYSDSSDCDSCPLKKDCRNLLDSLADRVTHYKISQGDYDRFIERFHGLKKQLVMLV